MSTRTKLNHRVCNVMIRAYNEVKDITDNGGVAYETRSAIWAFSPLRQVVTLYVKNPSPGMTNGVIDYNRSSKHFELHRDRILRVTEARATSYV
jgi:hypothetical protein